MKILLVDDQPDLASVIYRGEVMQSGHQCEYVRNLSNAFARLANPALRPDIILIDLMMDDMPDALKAMHRVVQKGLEQTGASNFNSGQALGLYLWMNRQAIRIPYGYLSSYTGTFVSRLPTPQTEEFLGASAADLAHLVKDRAQLASGGITQHCLDLATNVWGSKQWF